MNISHKFFLAIVLAFAIPLSVQANWCSKLSNLCPDKDTMAAGAFKLFKFMDYLTLIMSPLSEATTNQNETIKKFFAIKTIYQAHKIHSKNVKA